MEITVGDTFMSSDNTDVGIWVLHVDIYFQISVHTHLLTINVQSSAELTSLLDVYNTGGGGGGASQKAAFCKCQSRITRACYVNSARSFASIVNFNENLGHVKRGNFLNS